MEGRYVWEQVLNLTPGQAQRVLDEFAVRSLPENRAYRYRFIRRNCTTELRDIIVRAVGVDYGQMGHEEYDYPNGVYRPRSPRWQINRYVRSSPWVRIGINIIMGSKTDRIERGEKFFLPDLLYTGLWSMGGDEPLVWELVEQNAQNASWERGWSGRNYPYLIFAVLALALVFLRRRRLDAAFMFVLAGLGALIVFLMLYASHIEFKANFNLLLFNPLLAILGVAVLLRRRCLVRVMSWVSLVCIGGLYIVWTLGIQAPEPALVILTFPLIYMNARHVCYPNCCISMRRA
jgi:hypothetical protein